MTKPAVWPRLLKKNGTIGICSPAGPSPPPTFDQAADVLRSRGYEVVLSRNAACQNDGPERTYLAGSDEQRAADLNRFFADPDIDLILCARGGYGSAKLLDKLDWDVLKNDPKPLVGYSDITALSLGMLAHGVISFSGIMATSGDAFGQITLDSESEASFWQAVGDDAQSGSFPRMMANPAGCPPWRVWRPALNEEQGTVAGPLVPVCLSLLISLLGTPYVPDLTGAILVIEDVHEDLYAVDRALTQLRLAGILENVAGVLVGSFNGTPEQDALLPDAVPRLVLDMTPPHVPVASGIAYGHIARRLTLPVGAWSTANFSQSAITIHRR